MALMADTYLETSAAAGRLFARVFTLPATGLDWLQHRLEVARSRRMLLTLDDRMLSDIGLDRATARTEGEKGFWR
ncbi:DUF1127 domain-containing protein [Vineibacter terrae]|uniref:DUF1127 domain-containing protein n=1 Tax=Vineibacter terrae TaxID=2586908 RepID=UPI002E36743D|nr:hypothetical protein [Vineibacter terrae]HEX2890251.1 hypothetical protein [Vineibacter terrae]